MIFIFLYKAHKINFIEELRRKPQATGLQCPVEDCKNVPSPAYENRFCEYDILVCFYLLNICLKLDNVAKNFYVYLYGVIKYNHGKSI